MTSDGSSHRVDDENPSPLVSGPDSAVYGEDGEQSSPIPYSGGGRPSTQAGRTPTTDNQPDQDQSESSGRVGIARPLSPSAPLSDAPSPHISGADGGRKRVGHRKLHALKAGLGDRERAVLQTLATYHLLTTRQLERLLYPVGAGFTPLSAARTARRHLQQMFDAGLVDRPDRRVGGERAGSASYVYRLSALGARALGFSTRRRSHEPSLLHLEHVLAVAELVVQLHEAARTDLGMEVLDVQAEPQCWRAVTAAHRGRLLLKPDLRVTLGVGDHELHWFVEIDLASEHRPVLARKCQAYVEAWRDGSEQARAGVFPRVLWVVPDEPRAVVLRSVIAGLVDIPIGMFEVTTAMQAVDSLRGDNA